MSLATILQRKDDGIIVIDLGARMTKAVHLTRKGHGYHLMNYTLQEAPVYEKEPTAEALGDHLERVCQSLGAKTRKVIFAINPRDSILCQAELPPGKMADLRKLIRLNPINHLQQDLPDYVFDCFLAKQPDNQSVTVPLPRAEISSVADFGDGKILSFQSEVPKALRKTKMLVGGARSEWTEIILKASKNARLLAQQIVLGQICPVNAFLALPAEFNKKVVALVDIGFSKTTINILKGGELMLVRSVEMGADKLTTGLSAAMNINYAAAEGIKLVMPEKVQAKLQELISALGKELRASIDFFEHQYDDVTVGMVYVTGGSARSPFIIEALETDLMIPCRNWTPTRYLTVNLPPEQMAEVENDSPQLAVSIGAAVTWFNRSLHFSNTTSSQFVFSGDAASALFKRDLFFINLLAEQQELEEARRRDPVRRGFRLAFWLVFFMVMWVAYLQFQILVLSFKMRSYTSELNALQKKTDEVAATSRRAGEVERDLSGLEKLATNRFLMANTLNALQFTVFGEIQVIRLKISQSSQFFPATPNRTNTAGRFIPGIPANSYEKTILTLDAKDYGSPPAYERFIEYIGSEPYFKAHLRKANPIRLTNRQAEQFDPLDLTRKFSLFSLECTFAERHLTDE